MQQPGIIDLSPAIEHFTNLVQGDSLAFTVELTYENGDEYDLTGHDANMQLRRSDGSIVLTLTVGDGISIAGNVLTISISADDTEDLDPSYTYLYDVEIENGTSRRTVVSGTIKSMNQQTDI